MTEWKSLIQTRGHFGLSDAVQSNLAFSEIPSHYCEESLCDVLLLSDEDTTSWKDLDNWREKQGVTFGFVKFLAQRCDVLVKNISKDEDSLFLLLDSACRLDREVRLLHESVGGTNSFGCTFVSILESDEVRRVIKDRLLVLLWVCVGAPYLLNLRNVVWHGYWMNPDRRWSSLLSVISDKVRDARHGRTSESSSPLSWNVDIPHVPLIQERETVVDKSLMEKLKSMNRGSVLQVWDESVVSFSDGRPAFLSAWAAWSVSDFRRCTVLCIVLLEHCLRRLFVISHALPFSKLSAETDVLFLTFDDFLRDANDSGAPIPRDLRSLLRDLVVARHGPCVRTVLAHGEVREVGVSVGASVLGALLWLCSLFSVNNDHVFRLEWTPRRSAQSVSVNWVAAALSVWYGLPVGATSSTSLECQEMILCLQDDSHLSGSCRLFDRQYELGMAVKLLLAVTADFVNSSAQDSSQRAEMLIFASRHCHSTALDVVRRVTDLQRLCQSSHASSRQRRALVLFEKDYVDQYSSILALVQLGALHSTIWYPFDGPKLTRWISLAQKVRSSVLRNTGNDLIRVFDESLVSAKRMIQVMNPIRSKTDL